MLTHTLKVFSVFLLPFVFQTRQFFVFVFFFDRFGLKFCLISFFCLPLVQNYRRRRCKIQQRTVDDCIFKLLLEAFAVYGKFFTGCTSRAVLSISLNVSVVAVKSEERQATHRPLRLTRYGKIGRSVIFPISCHADDQRLSVNGKRLDFCYFEFGSTSF